MKFGIIGTGIVGTALAVRLKAAGYTCFGVHTRSSRSYERFSRYVDARELSLEELAREADILFITTQDAMIRGVAEELSAKPLIRSGQVWSHCSGSFTANVLRAREDLPVHCLCVHPLQAFASVEEALTILPGTHFGIEGDREDLGEKIVRDLGGTPHHILADRKTLYHAGAVVASNYLVVLASLAVELFTEAGIEGEEALASLLPLMRGTLYNLERVGLPQALTGPIARGDGQVVQSHLDCLPPKLTDLYKELGLRALELGAEKMARQGSGYSREQLILLRRILGRNETDFQEREEEA